MLNNLDSVLKRVCAMVEQASELAMSYYQTDLNINWKADLSPVTEADQAVERFLRTELKAAYPTVEILGEEYGGNTEQPAQSDYIWILDPIDGTRSFARGIPIFGIQVALSYRGEIILGVIQLPALNEVVFAAKGLGCFLNGKPASVSTISDPAKSLIYLHETPLVQEKSPDLMKWLEQIPVQRNWGDCYSFVQVITGRAEAALDPRMQIWDSAPLPILVQEAGGVFMDWSGVNSIWTGSAVVVNAHFAPMIKCFLERDPVL